MWEPVVCASGPWGSGILIMLPCAMWASWGRIAQPSRLFVCRCVDTSRTCQHVRSGCATGFGVFGERRPVLTPMISSVEGEGAICAWCAAHRLGWLTLPPRSDPNRAESPRFPARGVGGGRYAPVLVRRLSRLHVGARPRSCASLGSRDICLSAPGRVARRIERMLVVVCAKQAHRLCVGCTSVLRRSPAPGCRISCTVLGACAPFRSRAPGAHSRFPNSAPGRVGVDGACACCSPHQHVAKHVAWADSGRRRLIRSSRRSAPFRPLSRRVVHAL